jgi:uncharacterized membrane protein YphA (DoxX/SURF4 family)
VIAQFVLHGLSATDLALFLNRAILGAFFVLARFRWFYDPSRPEDPFMNRKRHEHIVWKLCVCGYGTHPVLAAFVANVEVFAGLGVLFGFLAPISAMGLLGVLSFATYCTAREKTMRQGPVDRVDVVSDYLWTVEPIYVMTALVVVLCGSGGWSMDHFLFTANSSVQVVATLLVAALFLICSISLMTLVYLSGGRTKMPPAEQKAAA